MVQTFLPLIKLNSRTMWHAFQKGEEAGKMLSQHSAQRICINVTSKPQCLGRWQDETGSYYAKVQLALLFLHASLPRQGAPGAQCLLVAGLEGLALNPWYRSWDDPSSQPHTEGHKLSLTKLPGCAKIFINKCPQLKLYFPVLC